jgi:hypothetical protein
MYAVSAEVFLCARMNNSRADEGVFTTFDAPRLTKIHQDVPALITI